MAVPEKNATAENSFSLRIRAVPNAKKTQIAGVIGDALKIKVQAVPEGGRANAELVAFLAELFGVPKRCVAVVSGETSRDKLLRVDGISVSAAEAAAGIAFPTRSSAR